MRPTLSILVPTIGRPTLERTLASIPNDPRVQVVLIGDGVPYARNGQFLSITRYPRSGDCGYSARNLGLAAAQGEWLAFVDDDDYFTPDGVSTMLDYCGQAKDGIPAVFKMERPSFGDTIWKKPELSLGNQGQPQFLCRNYPQLPKFGTHYSADFNWIQEVTWQCGGVRFQEAVTVISPQSSKGA